MRNVAFVFAIAVWLGLPGCSDECANFPLITAQFVDSSGADLYNTGVFHRDSLQVFSISQTDVVTPYASDFPESPQWVQVLPETKGYIFQHSASERDTVFFQASEVELLNCGEGLRLDAALYRGQEILPVGTSITIMR